MIFLAAGCVLKFYALGVVLSTLPYYLIGKQSNREHGCSKLFYEHESPSLKGPSYGWPLLHLAPYAYTTHTSKEIKEGQTSTYVIRTCICGALVTIRRMRTIAS